MQITSIRTSGLGDTTYVCVHEGVAAVVDPQRDFERFTGALDDASLRFVFETHLPFPVSTD